MWQQYNANPDGNTTEDCTIRAISKAMDKSWDDINLGIWVISFARKLMMHNNSVWGEFLRKNGWERHKLPDTCPDCYSVADFAQDHPQGKFIVACDGHVVAVIDGDWYDTFDSGSMTAIYYWEA